MSSGACGPSPGVLKAVKNTMSDRCVTSSAIDGLLEKKLKRDLNSFKCARHPLDSIAKECEKQIKIFEEDQNVKSKKNRSFPFLYRGESNTQALVRTVSKLFHDTRYNCSVELTSYLKGKGTIPREDGKKRVLYYRFVGNRFHVHFLSNALLFHYHRDIICFFVENFPPVNQVYISILNALQLPHLQISMRALGIVAKVVTGPWMRLIGEKNNILHMNEHYQYAYEQLKVWVDDASPLICEGSFSAFRDVPIKKDVVFDSLMTERLDDNVTKQFLQGHLKSCLTVMERQLKTQLPGGLFWYPTPELIYQAKSCSNSNISGERNFALADFEIHRAPAVKLGFVEGKVMFCVNKVHECMMKSVVIRRRRLYDLLD